MTIKVQTKPTCKLNPIINIHNLVYLVCIWSLLMEQSPMKSNLGFNWLFLNMQNGGRFSSKLTGVSPPLTQGCMPISIKWTEQAQYKLLILQIERHACICLVKTIRYKTDNHSSNKEDNCSEFHMTLIFVTNTFMSNLAMWYFIIRLITNMHLPIGKLPICIYP